MGEKSPLGELKSERPYRTRHGNHRSGPTPWSPFGCHSRINNNQTATPTRTTTTNVQIATDQTDGPCRRGIDEAFRIHQIGIAGHRRQDVTGVSLHVLQFHLFELGRESGIARYQILIAGVVNAVAVMVDPRCSISTINRGGKQVAVQEWRPIIVVIGWTGIAVKNQGTVVVVPVPAFIDGADSFHLDIVRGRIGPGSPGGCTGGRIGLGGRRGCIRGHIALGSRGGCTVMFLESNTAVFLLPGGGQARVEIPLRYRSRSAEEGVAARGGIGPAAGAATGRVGLGRRARRTHAE